jgi:chaperonin cofactor prefoldin
MRTYKAAFDSKKNKGVFGISLVLDPAMEGLFVALSKDQMVKADTPIELKEIDKEQRILMGLVLEPNKPIYRNQDGDEFNIVFDEDVITELSHNFFKAGHQKNSKLEHENPIEGVTFVESWIIEDSKIDKSANFGFSYPKGSWMATMKVDSDEIWNDYIKTGKVQGFSVDAMIDLKEINFKKDETMSNKILDAIKELKLHLTSKEPLEVVNTELDKDQVLEVAEAVVAEEVKAKEVIEDDTDVNVEFAAVVKDLFVDLKKDIQAEVKKGNDAIEVRFAALEKQNKDLKVELERLSEQPAARKIIATPSNIELDSKGKILTKLRQA